MKKCLFLLLFLFMACIAYSMVIYIKLPNNTIITVETESSDAIQQVKTKIQDATGYPYQNQIIVYSGLMLDEGRTLADYNIQKESYLQLILPASPVPAAGNILYVNQLAPAASNQSGSSWDNAITDLSSALLWARQQLDASSASWTSSQPLKICIAAGTYYPVYNADDDHYAEPGLASSAFVIGDNVQLIGGFPNQGNPGFTQRDSKLHPTILSGDPLTPADDNDNMGHVVIVSGVVDSAMLEGLTITGGGGNNNNNIVQVNGADISSGMGGGIVCINSAPTIKDLVFKNNRAIGQKGPAGSAGSPDGMGGFPAYGGAMYNQNASPTIINAYFINNEVIGGAGGDGVNGAAGTDGINGDGGTGGGYGGNGGPAAGGYGGAIYGTGSSPVIINTVFYNNKAGGGTGGTGGSGGNGGSGVLGTGGTGGNGGTAGGIGGTGGTAGSGGTGGDGGTGGAGSTGGTGGAAGGIGGTGGTGGTAGSGGTGGDGGTGGTGSTGGTGGTAGTGGTGGNGGSGGTGSSGGTGGTAGSGGTGGSFTTAATGGQGGNGGSGGNAGDGYGGAICITGSGQTQLINCSFSKNQAVDASAAQGGAAGTGGAGDVAAGSGGQAGLNGSAGNSYGGAVFTDATIQIQNSILFDNIADTYAECGGNIPPGIIYSYIKGNGSWDNTLGIDGGGNVTSPDNPYQDNSTEHLALKAGSAAIDAGSSGIFPATIGSDIDGLARIYNGNIDMGAFEFGSSTVPVELTSFTAQISGRKIRLTWVTAFESQNKDFIIKKSVDGRHFVKVATLPATTAHPAGATYNWEDLSPAAAVNYYQLWQTDKNGRQSGLGVRSVDFSASNLQFTAYPNPVRDQVHIILGREDVILVYSVSGIKLLQLEGKTGDNLVDLRSLARGIYFIRTKAGGQQTKIIKQ